MRWTGHVAVWGSVEVRTGFWLKNLRQRDLLEDLGIDGGVILKWIVKLSDGGMNWIDLNQYREIRRALLDAEIKPSGSIKCGKFFDHLKTC
jgi:hypothetical protein